MPAFSLLIQNQLPDSMANHLKELREAALGFLADEVSRTALNEAQQTFNNELARARKSIRDMKKESKDNPAFFETRAFESGAAAIVTALKDLQETNAVNTGLVLSALNRLTDAVKDQGVSILL